MITISFAAWLIPAVISSFCYALALYVVYGGDRSDPYFAPLFNMIGLGIATIISLFAWCVYFAVT